MGVWADDGGLTKAEPFVRKLSYLIESDVPFYCRLLSASPNTVGANTTAGRSHPRGQRQPSNLSQEADHGLPPQFRPLFGLDAYDADGCRDGEARGALRSRARQLLGPRGERRRHERSAAAGAVISFSCAGTLARVWIFRLVWILGV